MADDSDNPDKPLDDNETLVNALESIKSLLATSESKLSQARESISQASAQSLKMTRDVPVLEDVIVPGKSIDTRPENHDSSQTTETAPMPEPPPEQKGLEAFKAELEQEMHDKLAAYAAELEAELKARINAYQHKGTDK